MKITVNHIKGALTGAIIGETLAQNPDNYSQENLTNISPCLKIALTGIRSIINCYQIEQKSWLIHLSNNYPDCLKYKVNLNLAETAIALLGIILYRHEIPLQLEQDLNTAIKLWLKSELNSDSLLLFAAVVRDICQQKLIPSGNPLFSLKTQSKLTAQNEQELKLIRNYINQKLTLTQINTILKQEFSVDSLAIYQAIYCFFSLPDDFYLSLQRSNKFNYQSIVTSTLTGFLLGLNNGYFAIPSNYRYHFESTTIYQEINQLSNNLAQIWHGKYELDLKGESQIYKGI